MPESEIHNDDNGDGEVETDRNEDGVDSGAGGGRRFEEEEEEKRREVSRNGVLSISRDFRNAIKRSFGSKKKKRRKVKEKVKERADPDSEIRRSSSSMRRRSEGGGGGCYACFMQPGTKGPTSDPNSNNFSMGRLRRLIEKNNFYSGECNPHI